MKNVLKSIIGVFVSVVGLVGCGQPVVNTQASTPAPVTKAEIKLAVPSETVLCQHCDETLVGEMPAAKPSQTPTAVVGAVDGQVEFNKSTDLISNYLGDFAGMIESETGVSLSNTFRMKKGEVLVFVGPSLAPSGDIVDEVLAVKSELKSAGFEETSESNGSFAAVYDLTKVGGHIQRSLYYGNPHGGLHRDGNFPGGLATFLQTRIDFFKSVKVTRKPLTSDNSEVEYTVVAKGVHRADVAIVNSDFREIKATMTDGNLGSSNALEGMTSALGWFVTFDDAGVGKVIVKAPGMDLTKNFSDVEFDFIY